MIESGCLIECFLFGGINGEGAWGQQAERFGTQIVDVDIDRVDLSSRPFRLWARGIEYKAESVIVATGASAMWLVSACAT